MSERKESQPPELDLNIRKAARSNLMIYALARLVLFIVLTAVIQCSAYLISSPVPVIMSAMLALIVAFPLSMLVFEKQRVAATSSMAQWSSHRKAYKEWAKQELSGR